MSTHQVKVDLRLGDPSLPWDSDGSTTILKSAAAHAAPLPGWQAEIANLFPEYSLVNPIAGGALSRVFELVDRQTREPFALKAMPFTAEISSLRERLEREWRVLTILRHPNIVRGYTARQSLTTFYVLMERINGMSLQQRVVRHGPLPAMLAARYIGEAACGLASAHAAGVIHRDVKPSNLLVDRSDEVKVIDFGMALLLGSEGPSITLLHEDSLLGTIDYMAPEQSLSSHDIDARADIYSLGCTLHYLLTGSAPYPEGSIASRLLRHRSEAPPDLQAARPDVPPALVAMFERMVAKDPADRYANMDQVRDAVEQVLLEGTPTVSRAERLANYVAMAGESRGLEARGLSGKTLRDLEQLATGLSTTLQRSTAGEPVPHDTAAILGTLRDQIEAVLRRDAPSVAAEPSLHVGT